MGLGTNSGFNRSAADRWAGDRGDISLAGSPVIADALTGGVLTGVDRSTALTSFLADKAGDSVTLQPCYDLDAGDGGIRLGAESVIVHHRTSIKGSGRRSTIVVDPSASGPIIKTNIDASGNLIESEGGGTVGPGFDHSKISDLYFNGAKAVAAGNALANSPMLLLGDSRTAENIEAYGVQTLFASPTGLYLDGLTFHKIMVSGQPDGTKSVLELAATGRSGDGMVVSQMHLVRNDASANRPRAMNVAYTRGAHIYSGINGDHTFTSCAALSLTNWHNETGQVRIIGSTGSMRDCIHWMRSAAPNNVPPISQELFPGAQSVVLSDMAYVNQMFVYQEGIPTFAYDTVVNNIDIADGSGVAIIENCCSTTFLDGISASPSGKSGIKTGNAIFDAYSHFASVKSKFSINKWLIEANHGALGTYSGGSYVYAPGLQASPYSAPNAAWGTWNLPSGTYYFKVVAYLDLPRKIGQPTVNKVHMDLVQGGPAAKLNLDLGPGPKMVRIYCGTSASDVYTYQTDFPWIEGAYVGHQGDCVRGFATVTHGSEIAIEALANPRPARYELRPGDPANTVAYGNVTVWSWYNTQPPVQGTWNAGDQVLLMVPTGGVRGWLRLTNGSAHVLNTDWVALTL